MKSTLKAKLAPNGNAVIKIIRPLSVINIPDHEDVDERDEIINHLLQSPLNNEPYLIFQSTSYSTGSVEVTTILPVDAIDEVCLFKHRIVTMYVPKEVHLAINRQEITQDANPIYKRVNEFFNWLSDQNKASYFEMYPAEQPVSSEEDKGKFNHTFKTRRDYIELSLSQEDRVLAFDETPKNKLEEPVDNLYEAMKYVTSWRDKKGY